MTTIIAGLLIYLSLSPSSHNPKGEALGACDSFVLLQPTMLAVLPEYEHGGDTLPGYDEPSPEALPPTFKIDKAYTVPLVSVAHVRAHLLLLGAFSVLKQRVLEEPSPIDPNMREDVKWTLFLTRAALRFEAWVHEVVRKQARIRGQIPPLLQDYEIPPLDVCRYLDCSSSFPVFADEILLPLTKMHAVLCFHAYLLNPIAVRHLPPLSY